MKKNLCKNLYLTFATVIYELKIYKMTIYKIIYIQYIRLKNKRLQVGKKMKEAEWCGKRKDNWASNLT